MIITQPKELIGAFVNVRQGCDPRAPWGSFNALGLITNGQLVAGIVYNNFEGASAEMHVSAIEGSRWMTKEFLFSAFDYPFNQLGLRRVTGRIKKRNKRAAAFVKHLGFKYEGTMRHYFADDDALIFGLLRGDCRFIRRTELRKVA